jgi:poly-gamma-glutamate synthesis protein (capsule biosynthesis protein)
MGIQTRERTELVATGDSIMTQRILPYEGTADQFDFLLELLRTADASVTNLEYPVHDYQPDNYPNSASGGTYGRSPPEVIDELLGMGCDLLSSATNHTFDYSHGGILTTIDELERRNVAYAGVGKNLYEASRPTYIETPGGRVALLSATASFPNGAEATERSPAIEGRPGINPIHVEKTYRVPTDLLENLREISEAAGIETMKQSWLDRGLYFNHEWHRDEYFYFVDLKFESVEGGEPGLQYVVEQEDVSRLSGWISEADTKADFVIVSIHTHQGVDGRQNTAETPDFIVDLFRNAVESGADMVFGTGPHVLRGIEIYQDRPLFYSLGNFIMQSETIERLPPKNYRRYGHEDLTKVSNVFQSRYYDEAGEKKGDLADDRYWETIVPLVRFTEGSGVEVELYPCHLQQEQPSPHRGIPVLATGERAREIVSTVATLSEPFGTEIRFDDKKGIVRGRD